LPRKQDRQRDEPDPLTDPYRDGLVFSGVLADGSTSEACDDRRG
jgi:hypothetical protein